MKKFILTICAIAACICMDAQEHARVKGPMGELDVLVAKPQLKAGEKCPVVILMHGFISRKENALFDEMEKQFLAKGVAVIRFDFDGHGNSEGDFSKMTVSSEVEDGMAMIRYAESLPFTENISLIGHSQGGVIASMAAGQAGSGRIHKVVLMAPAAVLREDAVRGNTQGNTYDPINIPEEGVKMFGGRMTLGADFVREAQRIDIYGTASKYDGPVFLLHGLHDTLVPWTFSQYYTYVYKNSRVEYLEGDDHGFNKDMKGTSAKAVAFIVEK